MKVSKKLLAFFLAVMMVFATIPVMTASAKTVDSGKCGDNVKWSLDSNGTLTISGKGKMYNYDCYNGTNPPWYNYSYPGGEAKIKKVVVENGVTYIGKDSFRGSGYNFHSFTELKIADSVTSIGEGAFFESNALSKVDLGKGLKKIGDSAFAYSGFASIKLPDSLTYIGDYAFGYSYDLKSIIIPNNVKSIGDEAFYFCANLESVKLSDSLETIGSYAFSSCPIKKITIPKSVKSIGDNAFDSDIKIYGYKGSVAQTYAKENSIKFIAFKSVGSVTLSKTSYVYDGNVKKPTVTVKDSNGKKLKSGTDYTVKYSSGRKNVGQYTVTVTFKGEYNGTKKLTFKIVPKSTSISKLTAGKKQFTVNIKKQATQTTGYQVQYSKNSSMKNATTKTYASTSKTSRTIKNLKASTKYYVRVRTYKNVKINGKTTKLYSSWSSVKSVKTK